MAIGDNGLQYQHAIKHAVMATDIDTEHVTVHQPSTEEILALALQSTSSQNATLIPVQVSPIEFIFVKNSRTMAGW